MVSGLKRQGIIPATVIDVGANVGQFAVAAAKLHPKAQVYSFEPTAKCINALKRNTANLPNVKIYPIAIGEEEGEVLMNLNADSHASSILKLAQSTTDAFPFVKEEGSVTVKMSTLDAIFADKEIKSPCLLKLDIQGYEPQALAGGRETLKSIDYVIVEVSFRPMYDGETLFTDILDIMRNYGFHFSRPVGWLDYPDTGEILQMDALFARSE